MKRLRGAKTMRVASTAGSDLAIRVEGAPVGYANLTVKRYVERPIAVGIADDCVAAIDGPSPAISSTRRASTRPPDRHCYELGESAA